MSEKKVKDGKIITQKDKNKDALEKAKKKIKDKNYNVFSGQIQKDKNVQTNIKKNIDDAKKRKESQYTIKNGKKVLKRRNIVDDIGTALSMTPVGFVRKNVFKKGSKFIKDLIKKSDKKPKVDKVKQPKKLSSTSTKTTGGGQGSGRFITQRKNRPTGTQLTKTRNTQLKNPSRELVKRPKVQRLQNQNKGNQQLANRAVVTTGLSELIKPKKSIAKTPKVEQSTKKPNIIKPKKSPVPEVKKEKLKKIGPAKDYTGQFINKKGDVAYESVGDFIGYLTGKQRKRAKPKNIQRIDPATKGAAKGIGFSGKSVGNPFKFTEGGRLVGGQKKLDKNNDGKISGQDFKLLRSSKGMRSGGKVIRMRGGGAATRGMNFNRGY